MKKLIFTLIIAMLFAVSVFLPQQASSQVPEAFKYQAIARDLSGNVIANQNISLRINILQGSSTGTSVYCETHSVTSNNLGLMNLEIGNGTYVSGNFSTISWGTSTYYVKIEMDATGGTTYQPMGVSQLLSVPYALYAKNATTGFPGPTGPIGPAGTNGTNGINGTNGTNGATGATGANGTNGTNGVPGATGPSGGPIGPTGNTGTIGATGPTGNTGSAGSIGNTGLTGASGATGPTGSSYTAGTGITIDGSNVISANQRIIYGAVSSGGAILYGSGFTVVNQSTGINIITFTTPFTIPPIVIATIRTENYNPQNDIVFTSAPTASFVVVHTGWHSGSTFQVGSSDFSFIAIGN